MEPILLVRNAKSGLTERDEEIERGIVYLKDEGYEVVTITIQEILKKEAFFDAVKKSHAKTIVAVGGDGTVNLLAQYMAGTDLRLAVVPSGTFNHFAKHIGIGVDVEQTFQTIIHGETIAVDTVDVNGHRFVNFSCVGFYTQLIKRRVFYQKKTWEKWPAFFVSLYESFLNYHVLVLKLKKSDVEVALHTPLVFIGNNIFNFGGPDILAGRDTFTSGKLQVSSATRMSRARIVLLLLRSFFGDVKNQNGFTTVALDEVEIHSKRPRMWVSLDGEVVRLRTPLRYKIVPQSLHVIVPKQMSSDQ